MNAFSKLTVAELQNYIGNENLVQLETIISILSDKGVDPSYVYSKGFLSEYLEKNISLDVLLSSKVLQSIFGSFSNSDYEIILNRLDVGNVERSAVGKVLSNLCRKPFFRSRILEALKLSHLSYDNTHKSTTVLSVQKFNASANPFKQLKDYQFEVFFESIKRLNAVSARFVVQMPTGSGKTRTAMEIASHFLNDNSNSSVIWIAHSKELCDQACQCFSDVWPHLATRSITMVRAYGEHKLVDLKSEKPGFFCTTFQTMLAGIKRDPELISKWLNTKRLILIDEAHKATAFTYHEVIRKLLDVDSRVVGLTATPGRSFGNDETNQALADFFFNELVSFNPHGKNSIEYLRDEGVLSHAKLEVLNISGNACQLTKSELRTVSEYFDLPKSFLKKLGANSVRNAEIVSKLIKLVSSGQCKSVIYFAPSLDQSRLVNALLKFFKINSEHIDGDTPLGTRASIIQSFKSQKTNVLCNYEVLSTGFDAPMVDCVFIARPTASIVLYSQMVGRGLRGPAIGGKASCLVVNVRDNILNMPSIDDMFEVFDDYWISS